MGNAIVSLATCAWSLCLAMATEAAEPPADVLRSKLLAMSRDATAQRAASQEQRTVKASVDPSGGRQVAEVRKIWTHELAAIKRDMQRPYCRLEQSRHRVVNAHSLIHRTDKTPVDVVIRRTRALLEDLRTLAGAPDFSSTALASSSSRRNRSFRS